MEQEDNCIRCGKKFGFFGEIRSTNHANGDENICVSCYFIESRKKIDEASDEDTSTLASENHFSAPANLQPEAGATSQIITFIGWFGLVVSLMGMLVTLISGNQTFWIAVLVLFQSSVMVLGFGILVGNSDKLVAYAKQMANKES